MHPWCWGYGLALCMTVLLVENANGQAGILQLDLALTESKTKSSMSQLSRRNSLSSLDVEFMANSSFLEVTVNATVGTPPQTVQMLLDLGSTDFLLVSTAAPECKGNACSFGAFDSNASSTYNATNVTFNTTYAGGQQYFGHYATDDVKLGDLTFNSLQISVASETGGGVFAREYFTSNVHVAETHFEKQTSLV